MKKSTVLTFATAGAIVATSIGTFAAWDTTEATNSGTLTVGSPVTISSTASSTYSASSRALGQAPSYTSDVTFTVDKADQTVSELDVTDVVIYEKSDTTKTTPVTNKFNISIAGAAGDNGVQATGPKLTDTTVEKDNTYTVTITPTDEGVQGNEYIVDVQASIK